MSVILFLLCLTVRLQIDAYILVRALCTSTDPLATQRHSNVTDDNGVVLPWLELWPFHPSSSSTTLSHSTVMSCCCVTMVSSVWKMSQPQVWTFYADQRMYSLNSKPWCFQWSAYWVWVLFDFEHHPDVKSHPVTVEVKHTALVHADSTWGWRRLEGSGWR